MIDKRMTLINCSNKNNLSLMKCPHKKKNLSHFTHVMLGIVFYVCLVLQRHKSSKFAL